MCVGSVIVVSAALTTLSHQTHVEQWLHHGGMKADVLTVPALVDIDAAAREALAAADEVRTEGTVEDVCVDLAAEATNFTKGEAGLDLVGGDIGGLSVATALDCCRACWAKRLRSSRPHVCNAWTFAATAGICYLKGAPTRERRPALGVMSAYLPTLLNQACQNPDERKYAGEAFRDAQKKQFQRGSGQGEWGPTDLVLVTAWGRPEFLLASLVHLAAAAVLQPHNMSHPVSIDRLDIH
jgi:hypothetical protein